MPVVLPEPNEDPNWANKLNSGIWAVETKADNAQATATAAGAVAAAAQVDADQALLDAAAAQGTANTAITNAAAAQSTANTALTNAATAQSTANTALANAATAQSGADASLKIASNLSDLANAGTARTNLGVPPTTRTISAGTGLTGGGDLSANRTFTVSYGSTAGTAAQGNDARIQSGQRTYFYAYDYGFRCDGNPATAAANDTAFAAAEAAAFAVQGTVILPYGYGYISAPMSVRSRVGVWGAGQYGTVIQLADNSNCHMLINHVSTNGTTDPNGMFIHVKNLCLDGRGAHQSGGGPFYGIYFTTNPDVGSQASSDLSYDATQLVENCITRNIKGDGFRVEGRSDIRMTNCKATNSGRNGFNIRFDTHLHGCIVEKSGQEGFFIWGSSCQLTNCKAYICGQDTASVSGMTSVPDSGHGYYIAGTGIGEVSLAACDAQETTGAGFYLATDTNAVSITGTVQKSSFNNLSSAWPSVVVDNSSNNVISVTSKNITAIRGLALINGADRNIINMGHTPIVSNTATELLTAASAVLNNRVIVNGAPLATEQNWAASTAYITGQVLRNRGSRWQATAAFTSGSTFAATNLANLDMPWAAQAVYPGDYLAIGNTATGTSNTLGNGTVRAYAWYLPHDVTLTKIGAEVTVIGDVGSKVRLGIYADTGLMRPGALAFDAGTIAGDSATVQEVTISQTLTKGLYWVAAAVQDAATLQPTVRTGGALISIGLGAIPGAGATPAGWTHGSAVTTGALPATFTPSGVIGTIPRIFVKG